MHLARTEKKSATLTNERMAGEAPTPICASELGPGERTVARMVAALVGLAGVGVASTIIATTLSEPANLETKASDPDATKLARSAARGKVTSLASSLTFGAVNLANDYVCQINRLTSSVFMALLFGNIFGFVLDASFASDEGLRAYKGGADDGVERNLGAALSVGFNRMYSRNFVRYVLTLLTDVFVSSILLDELVKIAQAAQGRANAPGAARVLLCGPLASAIPTILTSVISVVTFMVYTNDTRFSWAFRTNRFPETLDEWALRPEVTDSTIPAVQALRHALLLGDEDSDDFKGYEFFAAKEKVLAFGETWVRSATRPRGRQLGGAVYAEVAAKAGTKNSITLDAGLPEADLRVGDYVVVDKVFWECEARAFSTLKGLGDDDGKARLEFLAGMHDGQVGNESVPDDHKTALRNLALALEGMQPSYQTTNFLLISSVAAALYMFKDIEGTPRSLKLALVVGFLGTTAGLASANGLERPPALGVSTYGTYAGYACYVAAALTASTIVMTSAPTDGVRTFSQRKKMAMAALFAAALAVPPLAAILAESSSLSVGAATLAVCFAAFYAYVLADRIRGARSRRPSRARVASAPSASPGAAAAAPAAAPTPAAPAPAPTPAARAPALAPTPAPAPAPPPALPPALPPAPAAALAPASS